MPLQLQGMGHAPASLAPQEIKKLPVAIQRLSKRRCSFPTRPLSYVREFGAHRV